MSGGGGGGGGGVALPPELGGARLMHSSTVHSPVKQYILTDTRAVFINGGKRLSRAISSPVARDQNGESKIVKMMYKTCML